jgi:hypothetical protein
MTNSLRIGIAGLGTVGASVIRLLDRQDKALQARTGRKIVVAAVSARDKSRDRGVDLSGATWFDDPVELAASSEIDLFVELVGGDEGPARKAVETALASGKSVVTANKALLAKHGMALAKLAEDKRVALAFEASAAGGIPMVKPLRGLGGDQVVEGIDRGREEDGVAALAGFVTESRRDVAFAEAHAAHQNDVGFLFDEREPEQVFDLQFVDLLRPVPAKGIQGLDDGEACVAHPPFDGALLAGPAFALEQAAQILDMGPALRRGVGGERLALGRDVREFQIREVFV